MRPACGSLGRYYVCGVVLPRYLVVMVVTTLLSCAATMQEAPWGNTTFYFPNQTNPGLNSTAAMISVSCGLGLAGVDGCVSFAL